MAISGLHVLARRFFPCFGLPQKRKSKKGVNERSPLLRANNNANDNTNAYLTITNQSDTTSSDTLPARSNESSRPRILNIRLIAGKTLTQALTLNPELIDLLQMTALTRRQLQIHEKQAQTQKFAITKRENEIVGQSRGLNFKLSESPGTPRSDNMIYSLQCAIQVLEQELQTFIQKRKDIDQDLTLRREQLCFEQAKIDAIIDLALTTANLLPPADQHESDRPTLQELGLEIFVSEENQSPLQTIIEERYKQLETAKEQLASQEQCFDACWALWKEEHDRGDDNRSEAHFVLDHEKYERALKHELEIAEEGYKCLLDAERLLATEKGVIQISETVVTPPRAPRRVPAVRDLANLYEGRVDSHRR